MSQEFNRRCRTEEREACLKQWLPQGCPEKEDLVRKTKPPAYSLINHGMRANVDFGWMPGIACVKKLPNDNIKIRYGSRMWVSHLSLNLNDISKGLPTA